MIWYILFELPFNLKRIRTIIEAAKYQYRKNHGFKTRMLYLNRYILKVT